jgi:predicted TPR repeat methyltransferase
LSDTAPLFVSSGDLIADRRYGFALELAARGDLAAAADVLEQTVAVAPKFAAAWCALGDVRERLGEVARAMEAYAGARDADLEDRYGARLHLARLGAADASPAMTKTYVRTLFDQYAARYDEALTEKLAYRGPALLRAAVEAVHGEARFGAMLDLGCGTGLAGAAFRPLVDRLAGVDLSAAMIARADAKGIYDRLTCADLVAFLAEEAAAGARYDLVLAADVFVYVSDLAPIVAAVAGVLAAKSLFAFTVETHAGDGVKLLPTLRYAHAEPYLRAALGSARLAVAHLDAAPVRSEKGVPVASLVVVATPS